MARLKSYTTSGGGVSKGRPQKRWAALLKIFASLPTSLIFTFSALDLFAGRAHGALSESGIKWIAAILSTVVVIGLGLNTYRNEGK
jgi:hypothetical protein